jgi:hypothetical protein
MKAYGLRKGDELEYAALGAPSRDRKMTSKHRKVARRLLHKQARNDTKNQMRELVGVAD